MGGKEMVCFGYKMQRSGPCLRGKAGRNPMIGFPQLHAVADYSHDTTLRVFWRSRQAPRSYRFARKVPPTAAVPDLRSRSGGRRRRPGPSTSLPAAGCGRRSNAMSVFPPRSTAWKLTQRFGSSSGTARCAPKLSSMTIAATHTPRERRSDDSASTRQECW